MSNQTITKGLSRLAHQFKDSAKFIAFIESILHQFQDLEDSGNQLLTERYLNSSFGVQLDGIGEIVGLFPRPNKDVDVAGIFGFLDDPTSLGFGDANNTEIGGNFLDFGSSQQPIGDDLYRLLIKAKIIRNQTAMTVDDTLRLITFTLGIETEVRYFLPENLKPRYDIGKLLTPFEEDLLDDFPVLIGIDSVEYHSYDGGNTFSFLDDATGLGFGDINNDAIGGRFAQNIT